MTTRLEVLSPELFTELRVASADKLRAATVAASEFALLRTRTNEPFLMEVLDELRRGRSISDDKREIIDGMVAKFDDQYFEMKEAAEESEADPRKWRQAFAKARAIATISFAAMPSSFESTAESIYEAAATLESDNKDELFEVIRTVLN